MAFSPAQLLTRIPIIDRNQNVVFQLLGMQSPTLETTMPLMLRLANQDSPKAVHFLPLAWLADELLLEKLPKSTVVIADNAEDAAMEVRAAGYRLALTGGAEANAADFLLTPFAAHTPARPNSVLVGIETREQYVKASSGPWLYYAANPAAISAPSAGAKRVQPDQALILELMSAIRQEEEPRLIEALFRRDISLSFKLLRYINSPAMGLRTRIESIRHALSILGYQPLLKWLALLASTAGTGATPALTHTAMIRGRFLELLGTRFMEKNDADNLFMIGMLSLLDRIMGAPLPDILERANLPQLVTEALLTNSGKYYRYLLLAHACEAQPTAEDTSWPDLDLKTVNLAHFEAIEWAAATMRMASDS